MPRPTPPDDDRRPVWGPIRVLERPPHPGSNVPPPGVVNAALRELRIRGASAFGKGPALIYGRQRVEGKVFYFGGDGISLGHRFLGVIVGAGQLEEITTVRINGYPVTSGSAGVTFYKYLGTVAGNANSNVVGYLNSSTYSNFLFPTVAWVLFDFFYTEAAIAFENIDSISFDVKGKRVYDFRDSTWKYSANAALCTYDFLTDTEWGCGVATSIMDDDSSAATWWKAANTCDETVDGEARYELNIALSEETTADQWLEGMRAHFAADIFVQKGKVRCVVDTARTTPVVDFVEGVNCKNVTTSTLPRVDSPTRVIVKFPNYAKDYQEDEAAAPDTEDPTGAKREARYNLAGSTSEKQSQRLARYLYRKTWQSILGNFEAGPEGERLLKGDLITLTTLDGLAAQQCIVVDCPRNADGTYGIEYREYDSATYSDSAFAVDTLPAASFGSPWDPPAPTLYAGPPATTNVTFSATTTPDVTETTTIYTFLAFEFKIDPPYSFGKQLRVRPCFWYSPAAAPVWDDGDADLERTVPLIGNLPPENAGYYKAWGDIFGASFFTEFEQTVVDVVTGETISSDILAHPLVWLIRLESTTGALSSLVIAGAAGADASSSTTPTRQGLVVPPHGTSAGQAGTLKLRELVANGTHSFGLRAPDALAASVLLTLPSIGPAANEVLGANATDPTVLEWKTPATGSLTVKETDGAPSVANVTEIRLTGATLTDEGAGAVTITVTPGAGGVALVTDEFVGAGGASQACDLSAALSTSDADSVVGVSIEGVLQPVSTWTVTDLDTITITPGPPSGAVISIVFFATMPSGVTGVSATSDTGDESTTDFVLDQTAIANGLLGGYVEGVLQAGATLISGGTTIRYATAPPNGAAVLSVVLY